MLEEKVLLDAGGNGIVSCCKIKIVRFRWKRGLLVVGENPIDTH